MQTFGVSEEAYPADTQHLNNPMGLLTDNNNLFVVEHLGSRVLKYRLSDGSHQLTIGRPGVQWIDNDSFNRPKHAALDSSGNIWVVDNNRVTQYDPNGNYLGQFPDWDHDPWACSTDNGHFCEPWGIDFDSAGRLYVSDTYNHRILVFNMVSGTPVYSTTIGTSGQSGSDNAHFNLPMQIVLRQPEPPLRNG